MHQPEVKELRADQQESIANMKVRVDNDDVVVIDVRNPDEVERSGKISAKRWANIPLPQLEEALKLGSEEFEQKYKVAKPSANGEEVVFNCGKGGRATRAVVLANTLGYDKVKNLDGGQSTWKRSY